MSPFPDPPLELPQSLCLRGEFCHFWTVTTLAARSGLRLAGLC